MARIASGSHSRGRASRRTRPSGGSARGAGSNKCPVLGVGWMVRLARVGWTSVGGRQRLEERRAFLVSKTVPFFSRHSWCTLISCQSVPTVTHAPHQTGSAAHCRGLCRAMLEEAFLFLFDRSLPCRSCRDVPAAGRVGRVRARGGAATSVLRQAMDGRRWCTLAGRCLREENG